MFTSDAGYDAMIPALIMHACIGWMPGPENFPWRVTMMMLLPHECLQISVVTFLHEKAPMEISAIKRWQLIVFCREVA